MAMNTRCQRSYKRLLAVLLLLSATSSLCCLAEEADAAAAVLLTVAPDSACRYDAVRASWTVPASLRNGGSNGAQLRLLISSAGAGLPAASDGQAVREVMRRQLKPAQPRLACASEEESCSIQLVSAVASQERPFKQLKLGFNVDSARPILSTTMAVQQLFSFSSPIGSDVSGSWLDARTLLLSIGNTTEQDGTALDDGSFSLRLRLQPPRTEAGDVTLRLGWHGRAQLTLLLDEQQIAQADVQSTDCEEEVILPSLAGFVEPSQADSSSRMAWDGLLVYKAGQQLTVAHSVMPLWDGDWTFCAWLLTTPLPPGERRTILSKGSGAAASPALLLDSQGRLFVQAATSNGGSPGLATIAHLPWRTWTHICVAVATDESGTLTVQPYFNATGAQFRVGDAVGPALAVSNHASNEAELHIRGGEDGSIAMAQVELLGWAADGSEVAERMAATRAALASVRQHAAGWLASKDRLQRPVDSPLADALEAEGRRLAMECDHLGVAAATLARAASMGQLAAMVLLAELQLFGAVESCTPSSHAAAGLVARDLPRAVALLRQAARGGHARALFLLAVLQQEQLAEGDAVSTLYAAASAGSDDAIMALAHRAKFGLSIQQDCETAAFYMMEAARAAGVFFHTPGQQPLHEYNRLSARTEWTHADGQKGLNDEQIQYQVMRAEEGHLPSIMAMADLYYYGNRGLPRDQAAAYDYFRRAADMGHPPAQTAVGNLLLKGEGVAQNSTAALEWYEKAAETGQVRALNGLGFAYYFGNGVPQNYTTALHYFDRSAALGDNDARTNAAVCYLLGRGTQRNTTRARMLFEQAASDDHMDALLELAAMYNAAVDGSRSCSTLLDIAARAAAQGPWGAQLRAGFNRFLAKDPEGAALRYALAAESGYEVGHGNAAFLLDRQLADLRLLQLASMTADVQAGLALRHYRASAEQGNMDSSNRVGDFHFYGLAGLPVDAAEALLYYQRASAAGVEQASYNLGYMYEHGLGGCPRSSRLAEAYYRRALQLNADRSSQVPLMLTLARLKLRGWLQRWLPVELLAIVSEADGSLLLLAACTAAALLLAAAALAVRAWRA
eukprot:PLAT3130.2.p1 GENE.PLAT3130.2~~PLAT3130.2.p1  ORF type:complete len:1075 (-),score=412.43 PLAT3130.2:1698-4922(-)